MYKYIIICIYLLYLFISSIIKGGNCSVLLLILGTPMSVDIYVEHSRDSGSQLAGPRGTCLKSRVRRSRMIRSRTQDRGQNQCSPWLNLRPKRPSMYYTQKKKNGFTTLG